MVQSNKNQFLLFTVIIVVFFPNVAWTECLFVVNVTITSSPVSDVLVLEEYFATVLFVRKPTRPQVIL